MTLNRRLFLRGGLAATAILAAPAIVHSSSLMKIIVSKPDVWTWRFQHPEGDRLYDFSRFNLHSTETGRWSSSTLNLSQIPKHVSPETQRLLDTLMREEQSAIGSCVLPDDFFDQQESRLLRPGQRQAAKNVVFGERYGAGPAHIEAYLKARQTQATALNAKPVGTILSELGDKLSNHLKDLHLL